MEFAIQSAIKMPELRPVVNINVIAANLRSRDLDAVDYSNSGIGDLEAIYLAARFATNSSITTVNLRNNDIGDDGVKMLAESLKRQLSVKKIDLAHNSFGDVGIIALADLKKDRGDSIDIGGVDLDDNEVSEARERQHLRALRDGSYAISRRIAEPDDEVFERSWTTGKNSNGVKVSRER